MMTRKTTTALSILYASTFLLAAELRPALEINKT
jgi:hypothetical protein